MSLNENAIAIIGIDLNFPGCQNTDEYWNILVNSIECIEDVPNNSIDSYSVNHENNYVNRMSVCKDYDKFDASFFGYSKHEARVMDPQHRLFLQACWKAFENAGYKASEYKGNVGVFGSAGYNTYLINALSKDSNYVEKKGHYDILVGNDKDYLATRVSHKMGLTGPSVTVQCACSSSLVGVHLACQSLLMGESDMCLAGAANVKVPSEKGYNYQTGFFLSEDGHCRAYDDKGTGTVFGSGVGVVVLKRLEDAIADKDFIYSVIRVTAINNDGNRKIGFTAPSFEGQTDVTQTAMSLENIERESIRFIEGHGTGTVLGDPIELNSIKNSFSLNSIEDNIKFPCAIGSVKSNIGHLDAAAGVAGLIKASLCLLHKTIVPTLYFNKLNSKTSFDNTRFYVANKVEEIKPSIYPTRAVVSAFGVGGTNACIILEEPPIIDETVQEDHLYLAVVSAKSKTSLSSMMNNITKLKDYSNIGPTIYSLNSSREEFAYRSYVLFQKIENSLDYQIIKESDVYYLKDNNIQMFSISFGNNYNGQWKKLYNSNKQYKNLFNNWLNILYKDGYLSSCDMDNINNDNEIINVISKVAYAELLKLCCKDISFDNIVLRQLFLGDISQSDFVNDLINNDIRFENNSSENTFLIDIVTEDIFYETLGRAWSNGLIIDWDVVFSECDRRHYPAPTYEFERNRFWFDDDKPLIWKSEKYALSKSLYYKSNKQYVLGNNHVLIHKVFEGIKERNVPVVFDEEWEKLPEGTDIEYFSHFINIDNTRSDESISLVFVLNTDDILQIENTYYKYIRCIRWLSKIVSSNTDIFIRLVIVKGDDKKLYENSMLFEGITNTIPKELPNIHIKQILCDDINKNVIDEIIYSDDEIKVFIENDQRYGVSYVLYEKQEDNIMLKEGGNYIITGGTGNVGLLFLREISRRVKANIVLISKNYNEKELFSSYESKEKAIQDVINQAREYGSDVEIVQTDISDVSMWNRVLKKLKQKYNNIDGIIHAASKVGKARDFIDDISLETIDEYMGAKVYGAHEINSELISDGLDFCIYVSSTTSLLGGIGDSVYAGVNAILNQMSVDKTNNNCSVFSVMLDSMPRIFEDIHVSKDDAKVKSLLMGQLTQEEFSIVCDSIFNNVRGEDLIISKTDFQERYLKEKSVRDYSNELVQVNSKESHLSYNDYKRRVQNVWKSVLEVRCDDTVNFFDAGGDSFLAVKVIAELNKEFSENLSIQFIYEFSTIELMAQELFYRLNSEEEVLIDTHNIYDNSKTKITTYVIGMAGRFPGADSIDELWENILEGKKSISHFKEDEYENVLIAEPDGINNKYVGARGIINDIDKFDYRFFGISKLEAQLMDPQQRLFIQMVWNALEDAGCINLLEEARIGVFASQGISTYLLNVLMKSEKIKQDYNNVAVLNNSPDSLATRVSYLLDLKGVSKTIQSFCSSSMVAIEDAITYIEKGKCDIAVVGGSNIVIPQKSGYIYNESSIYSATGELKPFDDSADGTIFGNAVGVVVLASDSWVSKHRLHSYAQVIGVGINNDGSQKANYLSPSVKGQAECVAEAYSNSGIDTSQVCFIETHGTATHVGDPIEIHALKRSFESDCINEQGCAIGSIKGNIGHLDRASGITSFIKACLVAEKHCIPPVAGYEKINDNIDLNNTPFYINKETVYLDKSKDAIVGVTSLGVGGTNVHIVLKSTSNNEYDINTRNKYIIPFSAKCRESLEDEKRNFVEFLINNKVDINVLAYVMQIQRRHFIFRDAYYVKNVDELVNVLTTESNYLDRKKINTIIISSELSDDESILLLQDIIREESWIKARLYEKYDLNGKDLQNYYKNHYKELINYCMNDCLKEILSEDIIILFTTEEHMNNILIDDRTICIKLTNNVEKGGFKTIGPGNVNSFDEIISEIWNSGIDVDWSKFNNHQILENVHLPGYSFKKERCWVDC